MVIGFDPDCDNWILIDANVLPSQLCTSEELSDILTRLGNFCVYSTETIVTKKNEVTTKNSMQDFKKTNKYKKLHTISPERIKRVNVFNAAWLDVAASSGDVDKVQELLDHYLKLYIDTNQRMSHNHTPIWRACQEGYTNVVELLLQYGAHPDVIVADKIDKDYCSPLIVAAQNGHIGVVRTLIHAGASVNWLTDNGETPLIKAAFHGHADVVRELIQSGAKIDLSGGDGATALLCASQNGHTKIVRMLLEAGATPNSKALFGDAGSFETPLTRAVDNDHPDIVKLLIEFGANIHDQSRNWMFHALCCKKTEIVRHFLNAGVDPNDKVGDIDSQCPLLYWAIKDDDYSIECIDALLKAGADPNAISDDGDTMLLIAVVNDNVDIISSLLKANVDVNNSGSRFDPPLCLAVDGGNEAIVSMLLNAGAKVDVRDSYGQTPLFIAVNQHSSSMVALLLAAGADPNIVRDSGATMLAYAACYGDAEIVRKLLKYKADVNQAVFTKKPDSNIIVKATVMDYARMSGSEEVIRLLEQHMQSLSCKINNEACRFFAATENKCVRDHANNESKSKNYTFT
jgi:cytohesin